MTVGLVIVVTAMSGTREVSLVPEALVHRLVPRLPGFLSTVLTLSMSLSSDELSLSLALQDSAQW